MISPGSGIIMSEGPTLLFGGKNFDFAPKPEHLLVYIWCDDATSGWYHHIEDSTSDLPEEYLEPSQQKKETQ